MTTCLALPPNGSSRAEPPPKSAERMKKAVENSNHAFILIAIAMRDLTIPPSSSAVATIAFAMARSLAMLALIG